MSFLLFPIKIKNFLIINIDLKKIILSTSLRNPTQSSHPSPVSRRFFHSENPKATQKIKKPGKRHKNEAKIQQKGRKQKKGEEKTGTKMANREREALPHPRPECPLPAARKNSRKMWATGLGNG